VLCLAYSPDGRRLAAGYEDHRIRNWDTGSQREILSLPGHTAEVCGLAFSPDGWRLASASADQTVKLWDATAERRTIPLRDHRTTSPGILSIAFSPQGRWLAAASSDRAIRIWDTTNDSVAQTLRGHTDDVSAIAFSPDGSRLVSAGADRTVKTWDVATGELVRDFRGITSAVSTVAFAPDGRPLACASEGGTTGDSVQIWNLTTTELTSTLRESSGPGERREYLALALAPDGGHLAAACKDGTICVWDLAAKGEPRILRGHTSAVRHVAFHPDSRRLASASDDQTVKIWDVTSGGEIVKLPGHTSGVESLEFSRDGQRLASAASDLTVKLWDVSTAQEVFSLRVPWRGVRIAFAPDGLRLALSGSSKENADHTLAIWDGRPLARDLADLVEARSRVGFLFDQCLDSEQVKEHLAGDSSLGAPVRDRAIGLVDAFGSNLARRTAEDTLSQLIVKGLFKDEVVERLKADSKITAEVRQQALSLSETIEDSPRFLNLASQAVARRKGEAASAYARALRQAQRACELAPYESAYQTTLGMALYRVGSHRDAVDALSRAEQGSATATNTARARALAFLAMAQHGLGQTDGAAAALARLRKFVEEPDRGSDPEAKALLREAEVAIRGEPAKPSK
jgi:WD40 repeat protein